MPSSQRGYEDKQSPNKNNSDSSNKDEDKELAPTNSNLNTISMSCTNLSIKVRDYNHNHRVIGNLDNNNNHKKFSKSASLLLRPNVPMSKQQLALSRSFDSNVTCQSLILVDTAFITLASLIKIKGITNGNQL